jgi:guanyl-specific ribonuclease Sa
MSSALARASPLKADIRLAQAVSEFEADLTKEQKSTFRNLRSQSLSAAPSPSDVMRLTADVDRRISNKFGGQCFGPRFHELPSGSAAVRCAWRCRSWGFTELGCMRRLVAGAHVTTGLIPCYYIIMATL